MGSSGSVRLPPAEPDDLLPVNSTLTDSAIHPLERVMNPAFSALVIERRLQHPSCALLGLVMPFPASQLTGNG